MHLPISWPSRGLALLCVVALAGAQDPAKPTAESTAESVVEAPTGKTVLLSAERLILRPGKELAPGQVLIRDGIIVAVGETLSAPEGAEIIQGKVVCAGFIDPWSSLGLASAARNDREAAAEMRTLDGFAHDNSAGPLREAARAGVLNARIQAGGVTLVGGVGAVVSLVEDGAVQLPDAGIGANLKLGGDQVEMIEAVDKLMGEIEDGLGYDQDQNAFRTALAEWEQEIGELDAKLEKDFKKAKKSREKAIADAKKKDNEHKEESHKEDKRPGAPKYNAEKEIFARVAIGEIPLVVEADRASVLRELLKGLAAYPRVRLVIAGGREAMVVAEELAKRRVPVIVYPKPEGASSASVQRGVGLALAAQLAEAEVPVLIGSGGTWASRDLPLLAALAVGHGLDADKALSAITLGVARAFDLGDSLGSVQRGRIADLLVLDGDPLSSTTRVKYALSAGRVVVTPED
ncbi:MAG: imidazolonepropionase-like amidohydrolase [Planctomycetota bacterium]|jgi:imidazolonepropionase-like amidohydrolase